MEAFIPEKQKYKCQECQRQFIENPTKKVINNAGKEGEVKLDNGTWLERG